MLKVQDTRSKALKELFYQQNAATTSICRYTHSVQYNGELNPKKSAFVLHSKRTKQSTQDSTKSSKKLLNYPT